MKSSEPMLKRDMRQISAIIDEAYSARACTVVPNGNFLSLFNWGFDSQTETYCDLVKAGIIDPTKVMRTALQDAASIAGLLISTEAMVAEQRKEDETGEKAA